MSSLKDLSVDRDNNLNLLRFVAASMVVLGHSYPITQGPGAHDPLGRFGLGFGHLGVCIFFVVSGYLISQSFERRHSFGDFVAARVLRIWPGLLVASLFTAFVVGTIATSLPIGGYLTAAETWAYPLKAIMLRPLAEGVFLPGVFEQNPFPRLPNGSVWTLYYEVLCYGLVVIIGVACSLFGRRSVAPVIGGVTVLMAVVYWRAPHILATELKAPLSYYLSFLSGMMAFQVRTALPVTGRLLAGSCVVVLALAQLPHAEFTLILPLGYAVLGFAFLPSVRWSSFNRLGDYSYGIYLFAFPIQQLLTHIVPTIGALANAGLAFAATLVLAVLSWHLVEKPSLALRERKTLISGGPAWLGTTARDLR